MPKKSSDNFWLEHLEKIDDENSADWYFLNQIKSKTKKNFIDKDNDFFATPLLDEDDQTPDQKSQEGQLMLDVYQTPTDIVIKATMAGVDPSSLDISLDNDILTIRGERYDETAQANAEYYYQECFWGKFSRSIVLPNPVNFDKIKAQLKNGILTILLPKVSHHQGKQIFVEEIE